MSLNVPRLKGKILSTLDPLAGIENCDTHPFTDDPIVMQKRGEHIRDLVDILNSINKELQDHLSKNNVVASYPVNPINQQ